MSNPGMNLASIDFTKFDPWLVPAAVPPPGTKPNFVDPVSRAYPTIVFSAFFTVFMFIFVLLRFYTKIFVVKKLGWDDFFCGLGAALAVTYVGFIIYVFKVGLGPHQWDVPVAIFLNNHTFTILQAIYKTYGFCITFTKVAICIFYLQLFGVYRHLRYLIHFGLWSVVIVNSTISITSFALCTKPTALAYLQCSPTLTNVSLGSSVWNVVSDFYLLLVPILAVKNLHLSTRKKLGVLACFSTGLLACCASTAGLAVRIVTRDHLEDVSWWLSPLMVTTILENHIGLIVGCMPILPRLMKDIREKSATSSWYTFSRASRTTNIASDSESEKSKPPSTSESDGLAPWEKLPSLEILTTTVDEDEPRRNGAIV